MKAIRGLLIVVSCVILTACSANKPPPVKDSRVAALDLDRIAVVPVTYATYQPDAQCTLFIDEQLRSRVVNMLRRMGYDAFKVGALVPRSFAAGTVLPPEGDLAPLETMPPADADAYLSLWIDTYWENNPCGGMPDPQYLTIGAVAILYAGSPRAEVWRKRAVSEVEGGYTIRDLIWLTTTNLSDHLLRTFPYRGERSNQ